MKIDAGADSAGAYAASLMAVLWFWCIDSGGGGGDPGASGKEICSVSAAVTASLGTADNLVILNMQYAHLRVFTVCVKVYTVGGKCVN